MSSAPRAPVILLAGLDSRLPQTLAAAGYSVLSAPSGLDARALAIQTPPDLVLVEPVLTDMSGTDACRLLRSDPAISRHLPILILFDGPPTPELRVAALRVGAWDFLSPSAGRDEILLRIASQLEAQRGVAEAVDEGLLDPTSGFFSQPGLARRAQMFAALMSRVRGSFACVVIELQGRTDLDGLGTVVARAVRISDVVGNLGGPRMAVLAPGTDASGAVRLAERIDAAIGRRTDPRGTAADDRSIAVGFDVITNARYSPIEPYLLIRRTVAAVHLGEPMVSHPWIRRSRDADWPRPGALIGAGAHAHHNPTP